MELQDFFNFYKNATIPIYSDLIALAGYKPEQILIEEANALSHLVQYNDESLSEEIRQDNLNKAYNHLVRLTIDLHKLVWFTLHEQLTSVVIDDRKRIAFNLPEGEVLQKYVSFVKLAKKARNTEMANVGVNIADTIRCYEEANRIGWELFEELDQISLSRIKKFSHIFKTKEFAVGVGASLTAGAIIWIISLLYRAYFS